MPPATRPSRYGTSGSATHRTTRFWIGRQRKDRVIISHDTDFGTLLAFRRLAKPSFVLIRSSDPLTPDEQATLLVANMGAVAEDLEAGAIVVFARGHLRSRLLPVRGHADRQ